MLILHDLFITISGVDLINDANGIARLRVSDEDFIFAGRVNCGGEAYRARHCISCIKERFGGLQSRRFALRFAGNPVPFHYFEARWRCGALSNGFEYDFALGEAACCYQ